VVPFFIASSPVKIRIFVDAFATLCRGSNLNSGCGTATKMGKMGNF
jgi:hypothetical protein